MKELDFPPGTKAYSYIRFSSAPQERGDSLRRQTEASETFAAAHGLVLDDSVRLQDLGFSAYDGSNVSKGALGAFLEAAKSGHVRSGSVLLVESLDRLSRAEPWQAFHVFQAILNQGITIITLSDGSVFSPESMRGENAMMPMVMSILVMTRAHEESARKSQRGRATWKNKRENANTEIVTSICPQWIKRVDKRSFELIPESAAIVRPGGGR